MRRSRWVLWFGLLAAAAAAALVAWPRSREADIVRVRREPMVQSVVATGRVATPARIAVSSQLAARIESIAVREGDAVAAGDVLARLRSDEAEAALGVARAALAEAEGRWRQLVAVQRPVAEQQLAQAEANVQLAEQERGRARDLLARGYVSQSRLDDAERTAVNARATLAAAQAQAQANRDGGAEAAHPRTRIEQARANVASAAARLELLALRAPADAVVLTREAEPGDTAQVGRTVVALAQTGETRIIAAVDEKHLRHLQPGQRASALADAFPGRAFEAELYYVAPSVDAQRGTVEVRLRVPRPPPFLRPEMTVSVEMVVGRRDAALVLPAEAVRDVDAAAGHEAPGAPRQAWVMVAREGRALRVPVELGLRGIGSVELVAGPGEGEAVILPSSQVLEGERVRERAVRAKANLQPIQGVTR